MDSLCGASPGLLIAVKEFCEHFPPLKSPEIAKGRCKMYSYELAKYLMRCGYSPSIVHVQEIATKHDWPTSLWKESPQNLWTHYVVICGNVVIDLTGRQFDSGCSVPRICTKAQLDTEWTKVEPDEFLNKVLHEHHEAGLT